MQIRPACGAGRPCVRFQIISRGLDHRSPFQDRVYFLLNYDCFTRKIGGVDRFKSLMTWLPTWDDARQILRSLSVPDAEIQHELAAAEAFERRAELQVLYELIARELERTMTPSRDSSPTADVQ